jgi:hypothetical protein
MSMLPISLVRSAPVRAATATDAAVSAGHPQILSGTGAAVARNAIALPAGVRSASIQVPGGGAAIVARFAGVDDAAPSTTLDVELGPGDVLSWVIGADSRYVAITAADGASAYRASVWVSSP